MLNLTASTLTGTSLADGIKGYVWLVFLCLLTRPAQAQDNITPLKKQLAVAHADTSRSRILYALGQQYEEVNLDSCLYFLTQSLRVAQQSHDPQATVKAMHRLGYVHIYYVKDQAKALDWVKKGIAIAKTGNDNLNLARCYQLIAIIAYDQHIGNPIEIVDQALVYAKKANDWSVLAETYMISTDFYMDQKNYKQADIATLHALEACEKQNLDEWFSYGLDYCETLIDQGKQAQAELFSQKLNAVKLKLPRSKGDFIYMNDLARLETYLKNYTGAKRILGHVLEVERAKSRPDSFHLLHIYRHLLVLYADQGDYKAAYALGKDLADVRVWLEAKRLSRDSQIRMTRLQSSLDIEKKEVQIALLDQQQQQQRFFLIGAIFVSILLLGFLFVLQRNKQRIEQQRTELSRLNTTQHKLFAILSHDLQSPVANLETNMMLQDWGALSQEAFGQSTRKLSQDIGYIRTMLQNVLHWSVSQMGGMLANVEMIAVSPIVAQQIQLLQSIAQTKGVQISNQIPAEAQLRADKNHLAIIFRNLLQNALKFTKAGGTVCFGYTERQGVQTISVADTGIGMSQDLLDHLFQLGKSSSRLGTSQEQGTGLGLVLVKELVKANQGKIHVASEVNKGTTFSLSFA